MNKCASTTSRTTPASQKNTSTATVAANTYEGYRLCNDCVLIAETGFALGKIKSVQDLIDAVEDKNLEKLCEFVKQEEQREKN